LFSKNLSKKGECMKKKISTICLLLILCLVAPILFCGCGNSEPEIKYVWNKTFSYQGAYTDEWESRNNGGSYKIDLLKTQFNNGYLDLENAEVNGIKVDFSSAINFEMLKTLITTAVENALQSIYSSLTVKIGDLDSPTIVVNGNTFKFEQSEYSSEYFNIINDTDPQNILNVGFFMNPLTNILNHNEVLIVDLVGLGYETVYVKIPTTNTDDPSADVSEDSEGNTQISINVGFRAQLNEVVEQ